MREIVKEYFEVLFDNEIEGIEGKLQVVKTNRWIEYYSNIISLLKEDLQSPIRNSYLNGYLIQYSSINKSFRPI